MIDERLILFKVRLIFKQYIPSKFHQFYIMFLIICDSQTGVVLDFIIYTRTNVDISLMSPYWVKGLILYSDNWYTSPDHTKFLQ